MNVDKTPKIETLSLATKLLSAEKSVIDTVTLNGSPGRLSKYLDVKISPTGLVISNVNSGEKFIGDVNKEKAY